MKHKFLSLIFVLFLQACVVQMPTVSSDVIESDQSGKLMNISANFCGVQCTDLAMAKAKEVCPKGFLVRNRYPAPSGINMIVRCEN